MGDSSPDPYFGQPSQAASQDRRLDLLRRARRAMFVGALASLAAVLAPPVGLACGILAIVLGARLTAPLRAGGMTLAGAILPILSGAFALVVGALLTGLMVIAGPELLDYRDCMSGANTQLAKESCEQQFSQGLTEKFPG